MTDRTTTPRGRRAASSVVLAVSLVVVLGFAALAVDIGALRQVQAQLQVACDAAALAGASHLDETAEGLTRAQAASLAFGSLNAVRETQLAPDEFAVAFGVWTPETRTFAESTDPARINAVRVDAVPRSVDTPLAGLAWYIGFADVTARAIGIRPPPEPADEVACFLPIAIPMCRADAIEAAGHPWVAALQLATDSTDTMGWSHPDGANAASIGDALRTAASGTCPGAVAVGDPLPMTTGVETSVLLTLRDLLAANTAAWDVDLWGPRPPRDPNSVFTAEQYANLGVVQGPILVFDEDGTPCEQVAFNRTAPLDRFAWGVLFDTYTGPGQHKGVQVYLDLEHEFETPGSGGGSGGNVLSRPAGRLVE